VLGWVDLSATNFFFFFFFLGWTWPRYLGWARIGPTQNGGGLISFPLPSFVWRMDSAYRRNRGGEEVKGSNLT